MTESEMREKRKLLPERVVEKSLGIKEINSQKIEIHRALLLLN